MNFRVRDRTVGKVSAVLALPAVLLLFFAPACAGPAPSSQSQTPGVPAARITLNVSAAASLTDALEEINSLYTQANPNVTITPNFASSGTLQHQIEQGAPCDVFIPAGTAQMDDLEKQGLLLNGARPLLRNKLVLVVPEDSAATGFADLASENVTRIALGDPAFVPAGSYARQAFDALGIAAAVLPKEVLASDVRQVLAYVETGNVDAGFVYLTDVPPSGNIRVVAAAPEEVNQRIIYPVAIIRSNRDQAAAGDYVNFLFGSPAQAIFEKHGFTVAGE